jgi:predicted TPR repeat methyltransferase
MEPGKGESYDRAFRENPYRAVVWGLEQKILDRILRRFLAGRPVRLLDFACGTGRVLAFLEDRVTRSTGIDISPVMLEVARRQVKKSTILEVDLTQKDVLAAEQFDLVTAFRFFPNAEPPLRRDVMAAITRHLAPGGYVVFNNHLNTASLFYHLAKVLARGESEGMSTAEVEDLVKGAGLRIVAAYGIGLLPATDNHPLLPRPLLAMAERAFFACGFFRPLCQDIIFVCERAPAAGDSGAP